ncbi:hypothetical protein [Archangium lipolyticum]|uniref:hypothetical protein n=1 Tax=Archangium lipolyticum TaxID=2970465 RepID=UPI002149A7BB|nr:hypothetical protein [Archangium lipolyticum]
MLLPHRNTGRRLVRLLLASVLLGACATGHERFGPPPPRGELRLDTESVARLRHASVLGTTGSSSATLTGASTLARVAPLLLVVLRNDGKANELDQRLKECAMQAERQVNSPLFGNREPTREECGEELDVDGCGEPITRAMLLGRQKHDIALACAREVLKQLWPTPFSIEQRYRFYPRNRIVEAISHAEEQQLIKRGCTDKLRNTIKPDIVLHADYNLLQALLIIDLKFPCPPSNTPRWREYDRASPYAGSNQGKVYKDALGGEALRLTPRGIF